MITPEQATILTDEIHAATAKLNELIEGAAVRGVNVTLDTTANTTEHYFYKTARTYDPVIDLDWQPPGTYAEDAERAQIEKAA